MDTTLGGGRMNRDEEYIETGLGHVPLRAMWGKCSRCGEHFPVTRLRPALGDEDVDKAPLLCYECFLKTCEEQVEELVADCGWTKKFENGEWCYYPPDEAMK